VHFFVKAVGAFSGRHTVNKAQPLLRASGGLFYRFRFPGVKCLWGARAFLCWKTKPAFSI